MHPKKTARNPNTAQADRIIECEATGDGLPVHHRGVTQSRSRGLPGRKSPAKLLDQVGDERAAPAIHRFRSVRWPHARVSPVRRTRRRFRRRIGRCGGSLPTPRVEPTDALPEILAMHFSSLNVHRGERWSGEFVTGTSVASVEVRTNLFRSTSLVRFRSFEFAVNVSTSADLHSVLSFARDRAQQCGCRVEHDSVRITVGFRN